MTRRISRAAVLLVLLLSACAPARVVVQLHDCTVYSRDGGTHYWTECGGRK